MYMCMKKSSCCIVLLDEDSSRKINITRLSIYRLDNESRQLQDLERRGNRCIDAKRECVYFGFQGDLNPMVVDDSSSNVFIHK